LSARRGGDPEGSTRSIKGGVGRMHSTPEH
jgi:hypothetical protein